MRSLVFFLRVAFVCALAGACSAPPPVTHVARQHSRPPAKPVYQADAYMLHLALADVKLKTNPQAAQAALSDIIVVDGYCSQKPRFYPYQAVLTISYTDKESSIQKTFVPVSEAPGHEDFSPTLEMLNLLETHHSTLQDMKLMTNAVEPCNNESKLAEADPAQRLPLIEARLHVLSQHARSMPSLQEARNEVALTEFFAHHHKRQAAYLLAENVKRSLARLSEKPADETRITALSKQLETVEGQLHTDIPFSIKEF